MAIVEGSPSAQLLPHLLPRDLLTTHRRPKQTPRKRGAGASPHGPPLEIRSFVPGVQQARALLKHCISTRSRPAHLFPCKPAPW